MPNLMDLIRSVFGAARPPEEHKWAEDKLRDQAARLKAMDAQVDAQRTSTTILLHNRRAGDRR